VEWAHTETVRIHVNVANPIPIEPRVVSYTIAQIRYTTESG